MSYSRCIRGGLCDGCMACQERRSRYYDEDEYLDDLEEEEEVEEEEEEEEEDVQESNKNINDRNEP